MRAPWAPHLPVAALFVVPWCPSTERITVTGLTTHGLTSHAAPGVASLATVSHVTYEAAITGEYVPIETYPKWVARRVANRERKRLIRSYHGA